MCNSKTNIASASSVPGSARSWPSPRQVDNARKFRGIYFIDPEDKKFKETTKNARKKLETPVGPAVLCQISKNNKNSGNGEQSNRVKSKLACILEGSESTRLRMGESLPNETSHCSITIWFTNLFLCLKQ